MVSPVGKKRSAMTPVLKRLRGKSERVPAKTTTGPKKTRPMAPLATGSSRRPTYQAAPILIPSQRFASMRQRTTTRSQSLLEMFRQARDFNPDVAKAVDNFITLCNPGYDLNCYFAKQQDEEGEPVVDEEGLRLLQQFAMRIHSEYSGAWDELSGSESVYPGLDTMIDMVHLNIATQGAAAVEAELTEGLDDIVDIYPVDPSIVDFQMDPATNRLIPGLRYQSWFTPLDTTRFRYVGKDPEPLLPGGRSPLLAVLDTVFFQQQFMRELQALAHFTNSPRLDVKILEEVAVAALTQTRPDLMQAGMEDARQAYMDGFITDIKAEIEQLEADDAFVHWDSVEAQFITPKGVAIPVGDVMAAIDKMMIAGVKQLPLLLGRNEGATTTHATVQWSVFILQLGGYQRISRSLVTWAMNLYLRIQGRQSYATLDYHPHKTSDELLDAQADNLKTISWKLKVDQGWADNDEAANDLLGHDAVGDPVPPPAPPPAAVPPVPPKRMLPMLDAETIRITKPMGEPMPHDEAVAVPAVKPSDVARWEQQYQAMKKLIYG
jgi:hypothetical protein